MSEGMLVQGTKKSLRGDEPSKVLLTQWNYQVADLKQEQEMGLIQIKIVWHATLSKQQVILPQN